MVGGAIFRGPVFLGWGGQLTSGAIVREAVIRGTLFLVGNCPRTSIIAEVPISKHFA